MFAAKSHKFVKFSRLSTICLRNMSINPPPDTTPKEDSLRTIGEPSEICNEEIKKFKMTQMRFQQDDGVPIHLKCGLRDRLLFYLTVGLAFFGLANTIGFIFSMAMPKKTDKDLVQKISLIE